MYGWRTARRVVVAALLSLAVAAELAAQVPRPELAIKTEFVLRFPEFVEWPPATTDGTNGTRGRPLSFCLSPSHPFGRNVQASATSQPRARRIVVRELREGESVRTCDVLYVAPADLSLLDDAVNRPILTVGDHPKFCQRGGIINLLMIDGRVRFEIELLQARRAGLKVDSQLLRLASRVYGGLP